MTKRLFAYLGLTMLSVYTVVFYFGIYGICAAVLFALIVSVCAVFVKDLKPARRVLLFIAVVSLSSVLLFSVYDGVFNSMSERYAGEVSSVTAQVKSDGVKRYGVYEYELKAGKIDGSDADLKMMLYSNFKLSCGYGDTIRVKANLKKCEENYYRSRGFLYSAESDEYKLDYQVLKSGDTDIFHLPAVLQSKLSEAVKSVVKGSKGELCAAVALGDRIGLSSDVNRMFSRTGLSFLIVISGLHMSMVSMFLLFVLRPLGKRRIGNFIRCAVIVIVLVLYILITGCTVSVVRSGIAVILTTLAVAFRRRSDAFNSLGLAAFIVVFMNPYAVGDVGMLLSFSSVFGILYFYPKLISSFDNYYNARKNECLNEIRRTNQRKRQLIFRLKYILALVAQAVITIFLVSLSAVITSMPVVSLTLGYINPATIITSVFLTPLIMFILIFTLLIALMFYIPLLGFLSYFSGAVADVLSEVVLYIVRLMYSAKYLTLYLDRDIIWLWLFAAALLVGMTLIIRRTKSNILIAVLLSFVFLFGSYGAKYIVHSNQVTAKVISLTKPSVKITGGGVEALLSYGCDYDKTDELIRKNRNSFGNVRTLVIPDDSLKISRIANTILDGFDVESVMMYHSKRTAKDTELKAMSCRNYKEFYNSDVIRLELGHGITDTIIHDGKSSWQYIESKTKTVLIVPDKAEVTLLNSKYRKADVIVCGSDIKNLDLLGKPNTTFLTGDNNEDVNIRLGG